MLTRQDLLDRIAEFVDEASLPAYLQKELSAYRQLKQDISDLEASRSTHENPAELESQITAAKEKLAKKEKSGRITTVVNRARQSIYREYASQAISKFQLQATLKSQQAVLDGLHARLNSIKTSGAESLSLEITEVQKQIAEQESLTESVQDKLTQTEKSLADAKSQATAIIDPEDRSILLFDDKQVVTINGKRVVIIEGLFDPEFIDKQGQSNLDRIAQGLTPYGFDGELLNIHHIDQTDDGMVVAIPVTLHQRYDGMLHFNKGQSPSQINRNAFGTWRKTYWKWVWQQYTQKE